MKKILFIASVVILLLIINNLSRSIYDLWQKQDLLTKAQKELVKEQQLNQKLKAELSYAKTRQFVEEEARNKLFLAKPGEQQVLISENQLNLGKKEKTESKVPNWRKWWNLFNK